MKKVLAIDDDPINRQLLEIYLKGNFDYKIVNNATQAVEQLSTNEFDIVVTDINLEGDKDGIWIGKHVKSTPQYAHVPVVAFTAHMAGFINSNNVEVFDHIIGKPILKAQFVARINELLTL